MSGSHIAFGQCLAEYGDEADGFGSGHHFAHIRAGQSTLSDELDFGHHRFVSEGGRLHRFNDLRLHCIEPGTYMTNSDI